MAADCDVGADLEVGPAQLVLTCLQPCGTVSGDRLARFGRHGQDWVRAVAVLPDGRIVTGGDDGRVLLWDPADPHHPPAELGRHEGWVFAVAALPGGRVASGGQDGRALLCDPASGCIEFARLGSWIIALAAMSPRPSETCLVAAHKGHAFRFCR